MQRVLCLFSLNTTRHLAKTCPVLQQQVIRQFPEHLFKRRFVTSAIKMSFFAEERGKPNTLDYRVYFYKQAGDVKTYISPFHDIPLYANEEKKILNMVVEIPRWTNSKMEISKDDPLNPIKQDIKKGNLRFVKNIFPHHGYIWNYGALPQTWEDPNKTEEDIGTKGDNDPLDVCEIGQTVHKRGTVIQVKVLGTMCLIDEGETDWKILAIDVNDPLADQLNDIGDVDSHMPGFLTATHEWFTYYKVPDGKPTNQFAYDGKARDKAKALQVIEETHKSWQLLVSKETDAGCIACHNTLVAGSPYMVPGGDAEEVVEKTPALGPAEDLPTDVDKWYYPIASSKSSL